MERTGRGLRPSPRSRRGLIIEFEDGHRQIVATDHTWLGAGSGIVADDLYDGQIIDARKLLPAAAHKAGVDSFAPVRVIDVDTSILDTYVGPPVRRQEEIAGRVVGRTEDGGLILDFGQNLVGWLRVSVTGAEGDTLVIRHAEVLEGGDLATRPLRSAKATVEYILSGGADIFEPTFTFHGFRYAKVMGWTGGEADLVEAVRAIVIGSELQRTGTFSCSEPDLVQLHRNVVWGMRGNFIDIPTDCPQRDERLGYVGDLATFAPSATFLYDVDGFLREWFRNLELEQELADGKVPLTVPNALKYEKQMELPPELLASATAEALKPVPLALWQDGAVWIPWAHFEAYGDISVLEQQRASIDAYMEFVEDALSEDGTMSGGFQLGDWLDPAAPPENPRAARADSKVAATACMFRTADLSTRIAQVLRDDAVAARRAALTERIRQGFIDQFVEPDGRIRSDAATVYALPVAFGLLTGPAAQQAGDRLAELVAEGDHVIPTGFIGTPFLLHALSRTGHVETAYRLLLQTECPSWLYQVRMGATTIWERWDAMLPDGRINPGEMTSFNHYAFGSVADWLHKVVAGLAPLEPGYAKALIAPLPGGGLTSAEACLDSPRGRISVAWHLDGGDLILDVEIPETVEAILRLPNHPDESLAPGHHIVVKTLHRTERIHS